MTSARLDAGTEHPLRQRKDKHERSLVGALTRIVLTGMRALAAGATGSVGADLAVKGIEQAGERAA